MNRGESDLFDSFGLFEASKAVAQPPRTMGSKSELHFPASFSISSKTRRLQLPKGSFELKLSWSITEILSSGRRSGKAPVTGIRSTSHLPVLGSFHSGFFSLFQTTVVHTGRAAVPNSNFTKGSDSSSRSALRRFFALIFVKLRQPVTVAFSLTCLSSSKLGKPQQLSGRNGLCAALRGSNLASAASHCQPPHTSG